MTLIKLPSGRFINMDQVEFIDPKGSRLYQAETDIILNTGTITLSGADEAAFLSYCDARAHRCGSPKEEAQAVRA
jgi:hypothetical protein